MEILGLKAASIAWIVALLGLLGYEMYAIAKHKATLSQAVWVMTDGQYGAMIPFIAGLLIGHFFFAGR